MPTVNNDGTLSVKAYYATAHYQDGCMWESIETNDLDTFIQDCQSYIDRGFSLVEMDSEGNQVGPLSLTDYS